VTVIVSRSLELANWPPLEMTKQLPRRVAIWTQVLLPRVPVERLPEVFDAALDEVAGDYPLSAYSLLKAWRAIRQREEAEERAEAKANEHLQPKPCDMAHSDEDEKLVPIHNPKLGVDVSMPCPNCRPVAFNQRQQEVLRRAAEDEGRE
jgi:hypothetical protein